MSRTSHVKRETTETKIAVDFSLDGSGLSQIATGVPFFDHMLELFARHGLFDLRIEAKGDLQIDAHHTVEDVGIALGEALVEALGEKSGINRYGDCLTPMDEVLAAVAVDISGRPGLHYAVELPVEYIGAYDTSLTEEFLQALVNNAGLTVHVNLLSGGNAHHVIEAVFKGLGRALGQASGLNERVVGVPSTKGKL